MKSLRFLLLQVRNPDDPMRPQEVQCFADAIGCEISQIETCDLIREPVNKNRWNAFDIVMLGGSGDYSVAEGGAWLPAALDSMRELYEHSKPTFASCWGFQAMARAMGGEVVTDLDRAELGTLEIQTTSDAANDPVFGHLGSSFSCQMGHQDIVDSLPIDALRLAVSSRVENEAFRFRDKPIYCTQFHPELNREALVQRLRQYPQYVERIAGMPLEEFCAQCQDTPAAAKLLPNFVRHVTQ